MKNCVFCQIREGKIPTKLFYEDADVMVFPDIHPQAKTHLLIVPKKHVPEFLFVEGEIMREKLFHTVQSMINKAGLRDNRYQIKINGGGLQDVNHLHIHLLGPLPVA